MYLTTSLLEQQRSHF
uniref:Uncharacterized protein n=1 Tax=Anguilla anguilla TaxID=7936 RepID=A0A0E9UVE0_ANGAN